MILRNPPSGPIAAETLSGIIPGPATFGAFTHQVVTNDRIHEGDYAIPQVSADPDAYVVVFQHAVEGAAHFFVFNIDGTAPDHDIPLTMLVFHVEALFT